jgi:hypothetical protein
MKSWLHAESMHAIVLFASILLLWTDDVRDHNGQNRGQQRPFAARAGVKAQNKTQRDDDAAAIVQ